MDLTFGTALSQSGRLLQLTTPLGEHQLQALRMHGVERIGRVPRYTLDVVVQDTEYDPEKLIGQPVSLAILCDDGSPAQRHGLVESVRYLGNDGGLHDWQLVFAPWFSLLEYRLDCRIWQDKNLPAILEAVFSLYEQAKGNYRLDLRREYAPLSYVTQFNESDANFVQRWCEQEGLLEDGREHATASMAKTGCDDDLLYISPRQAIPIIFVPGIMGTPLLATGKNRNLVNKLDGKWSWFPDSLPWLGISFSSGGFNRLNPAQKKILLDPDQTKVPRNMGEANFSGLDLKKCILPKAEMEKRGWGTVILGKNGYGGILNFLEAELKTIYTQGEKRPTLKGTLLAFQSELESIKGYEALSSDSLRNASAWSYPVFACGYNWLRSNEESADYLASYIQFVLDDCRTRLKLQCTHVILVTHSMGGLVARRCAQKAPNNILGVVHGVQPAIGAGTAYRRVRAGWEDFAGRLAVGENSNEVTPIFAAPGPLQLLPNQLYGNHWSCDGALKMALC